MIGTPDENDLRWQVVESGDVRAAGCFVYRREADDFYHSPICRLRPVERADIVFLDTPDAAREQGFKPCGECCPEHAEWLAGASRWM